MSVDISDNKTCTAPMVNYEKSAQRPNRIAAATLVLATVVFCVSLMPLGLDRDDVSVFEFTAHTSYAEVWTSPFRSLYYRPIVVTIVKLSSDLFGTTALPLRILQGILIGLCLYGLNAIVRPYAGTFARTVGGLCVLASPLTFVSVAQFGVGVADSIVVLAFLACVGLSLDRGDRARTQLYWICLSAIAVLAKESGLLVVAFCFLECLRRRHWLASLAILGLGLGYMGMRGAFVSNQTYVVQSGFLLEMLTTDELRTKFGTAPYSFYLYNAGANLSSLLFYLPVKGQLRLSPLIALLSAACTFTSLITVRYLIRERAYRRHATLIALIPINAVLGYAYVRARIMLVGYVAFSILFILALDDLRTRKQRVFGLSADTASIVALLMWLAVLGTTLVRLWRMKATG